MVPSRRLGAEGDVTVSRRTHGCGQHLPVAPVWSLLGAGDPQHELAEPLGDSIPRIRHRTEGREDCGWCSGAGTLMRPPLSLPRSAVLLPACRPSAPYWDAAVNSSAVHVAPHPHHQEPDSEFPDAGAESQGKLLIGADRSWWPDPRPITVAKGLGRGGGPSCSPGFKGHVLKGGRGH